MIHDSQFQTVPNPSFPVFSLWAAYSLLYYRNIKPPLNVGSEKQQVQAAYSCTILKKKKKKPTFSKQLQVFLFVYSHALFFLETWKILPYAYGMIAHSLFLPYSVWSGRWAKLNLMRFSLSELFSISPSFYFKHSLTACILYQHWVQICSWFPSHTLPLPQWSKSTSLTHLIGSQSSFCCSFQWAFPSTCLQKISCVIGLSHCLVLFKSEMPLKDLNLP